jgi:hypothetical protein
MSSAHPRLAPTTNIVTGQFVAAKFKCNLNFGQSFFQLDLKSPARIGLKSWHLMGILR